MNMRKNELFHAASILLLVALVAAAFAITLAFAPLFNALTHRPDKLRIPGQTRAVAAEPPAPLLLNTDALALPVGSGGSQVTAAWAWRQRFADGTP